MLDVKVGRGAFMKDRASARELAHALVRVGTRAGKNVVALLTDMDAPLGRTVGNANETREAHRGLARRGPADLVECTLALGAEMLVLGGRAKNRREAHARLARRHRDGSRGSHDGAPGRGARRRSRGGVRSEPLAAMHR